MMYRSNFVCSLKVGGKILRENSGVVTLPFGSEYGVLLKNLGSRRAMVKVSVDGQDATEGTRLILQPNSSLELERFIKEGNLKSGNRFKFIERTKKIEDHRGIKEDDGLVRVEFWAEKEVVDVPIRRTHYYDEYVPVQKPHWVPYPTPYYPWYPWYPYNDPYRCWTSTCGSSLSGAGSQLSGASGGGLQGAQSASYNGVQMNCSSQSQGSSFPRPTRSLRSSSGSIGQVMSMNMASSDVDCGNDAGITVPGSKSNQSFYNASGFDLESNSHVIVLQLRGSDPGGAPIEVPVTVDLKPTCSICGQKNKFSDKFCGECGTALKLI